MPCRASADLAADGSMPDRTVDPAVSRKRDDPAINTANIARSATVIPEVKRLASKPVVRMENTEVSSLRFMVSFNGGKAEEANWPTAEGIHGMYSATASA